MKHFGAHYLYATIVGLLYCLAPSAEVWGQRVPNEIENIDYLVTFSKNDIHEGDDDHMQVFFFSVPETHTEPVYLRVYDPDVGGKHDQAQGRFDSKTKFSIYGGNGAFSNKSARKVKPSSNFKTGVLVASKIFGINERYDDKWYTFGPLNPQEGEKSSEVGGYVFKVLAEGVTGDDGNLYRYFMSVMPDGNKPVEGANAFAYKYTFRLPSHKCLAHIYPFVDKNTVSITQSNFDFDGDGEILIYSVAKNREVGAVSGDGKWASSKHTIVEAERNTTLDIQIMKKSDTQNNMSLYITNQYNEVIPFFALPIGGPPKYKYKYQLNLKNREE